MSISAVIVILIFLGLSIFQLLLALGKPYGKAAYGGKYEVLPNNMRILSGVAILIFVIASLFVAVRAEFLINFPFPDIANLGVWVFALYLSLNTVANFLSESKLEKQIMTPLSLIAAICLFIIALNL
jgi:hypothetical protein